ncbi:MAG: hypothetical protein HQ502_00835, partial [Alphaproteobacteria bacterium]|nr:hypothetical protein [Alphaproteobacteria bacterium]
GIPFTTLRATSHQTWLDFTATGDIPGSHEPPAYAIVLIEPNQVVVHFHDFLDASPKFAMGGTNWESWAKLPAKETVSA